MSRAERRAERRRTRNAVGRSVPAGGGRLRPGAGPGSVSRRQQRVAIVLLAALALVALAVVASPLIATPPGQ